MSFSIADFKGQVLKNGLVKSNLYRVYFYPNRLDGQRLQFYTESVTLPTIELETSTIHRYGYGPSDQYVFRPVFTSLSIDFMVEATDRNSLTEMLGELNRIANFMGYPSINGKASTGANPYEMEYKQKYIFDLEIVIYNEKEDQITAYLFRDCFAKQIGSIQLGWGLNDQLLRLPVTFSYTDYSISQYDETRGTDTSTNTENLPGGQYPSPTAQELTSI